MTESSSPREARDPYELRNIVGKWLRIRAEHVEQSVGIAGSAWGMLDKVQQQTVLQQLAADAEHSDLLVRLFRGDPPMTFIEWGRTR